MTFSCARLAVDALLLGPAEAEMDCEGLVAVRGADPVRLGRLAKVNLAPVFLGGLDQKQGETIPIFSRDCLGLVHFLVLAAPLGGTFLRIFKKLE